MVWMAKVAEFMEHDIVPKILGDPHEIEVQIYVSFPGATAPVGDIILDPDLVVFK